ncbi:MAG: DUF169 domain-containing protein [Clostridiales bacterium]|nr:DUF169 domain-containing protein [Clostridiales bacterium]
MTVGEYNAHGAELERLLLLRDAPVAMKVLYEGDEPPEDAVSLLRETGRHFALCQTTALVRRGRKSVVMYKEDHWCIWPLISYGITTLDEADYELLGDKHFYKDAEVSHRYFKEEYPHLKTDKSVVGLALAPLASCTFEPDIVCIYCYPAQLRSLLMASKYESGAIATSALDTCASCVHGQIPVLNGETPYNLSIPDPGEYERGLCDENELIFNVRGDRTGEQVQGLKALNDRGFGYSQLTMDMKPDYARPEFYNSMVEKWGLERGEVWIPGKR